MVWKAINIRSTPAEVEDMEPRQGIDVGNGVRALGSVDLGYEDLARSRDLVRLVLRNLVKMRDPCIRLIVRENVPLDSPLAPRILAFARFVPLMPESSYCLGDLILATPRNRTRRRQYMDELDQWDRKHLREAGWTTSKHSYFWAKWFPIPRRPGQVGVARIVDDFVHFEDVARSYDDDERVLETWDVAEARGSLVVPTLSARFDPMRTTVEFYEMFEPFWVYRSD